MKSLQESLFDKDIIEKEICIFDYYNWRYDTESFMGENDMVTKELNHAQESEINDLYDLNKLNKVKNKTPTLDRTYLSAWIYDGLSRIDIDKIKTREKLAGTIDDIIRQVIKPRIVNGGCTFSLYPTSRKYDTILDPDIKSYSSTHHFRGKLNGEWFELIVAVSLGRKQK